MDRIPEIAPRTEREESCVIKAEQVLIEEGIAQLEIFFSPNREKKGIEELEIIPSSEELIRYTRARKFPSPSRLVRLHSWTFFLQMGLN